ncbi:MAG: hypothetical protein ACRECE_08380 [Xanthobacteraceae bacterium]
MSCTSLGFAAREFVLDEIAQNVAGHGSSDGKADRDGEERYSSKNRETPP